MKSCNAKGELEMITAEEKERYSRQLLIPE